MFTIGQFADLTGVSAKRLRHYDRVHLFRPARVDPVNHYRYYSAGQLPELRRILALIDLGVPLARIAELMEDPSDVDRVLSRRRTELERHRADMDRRLAALDIRLHRTGPRDVVVRHRPRGKWLSLRQSITDRTEVPPLFDEAEAHAAAHGARDSRPPACVVHESTRRRKDVELLIPVVRRVPETDRLTHLSTPASRVVTHLLVGRYDGLDEVAAELRSWAEAVGLSVAGAPWYVYLRFSADDHLPLPERFLTARRPELLTEVQVPVA